MNILFLIPPNLNVEQFVNPAKHNSKIILKKDGKYYGNIFTEMPLGILSISSYIKKNNQDINVKLLDFNVLLTQIDGFKFNSFKEYFLEVLNKLNYVPDIIAVSLLFTNAYINGIELIKSGNTVFPNANIIVGGCVATNMYNELLQSCPCIDALCFGEGEMAFDDMLHNSNFEHKSWITRSKLAKNILPQHHFIDDLDNIPLYDYGLININDYTHPVTSSLGKINLSTIKYINYMTSRGCNHKCTFCASHTVHGFKIRSYGLKRVRQDLEYFKSIGIDTVVFFDDHILFNKKRFKMILLYLKELNLKPIFPNALAMYALTRDILEQLKDLGIEQNQLSIESGSERVLKEIMHKPLNRKIIQRVIKDCRELGLYTTTNIIIGLPGETKQDIDDAVEFLKTIGTNWFLVVTFIPLVGSKLYQICIDNNYIQTNTYDRDYKTPILTTEHFDVEYMKNKLYEVNLELNFIYNYDFLHCDYKTALIGFKNAINAKPTHALAHYYISKCYKSLGDKTLAKKHINLCKQNMNEFWTKIFQKYNIKVL